MINYYGGRHYVCKVWVPAFVRKRRSFFLYQSIFCIFSLLIGCSSLAPKTSEVKTFVIEPEARAVQVNFEILGRISAKKGEKGFSGGLRWRHTNTDDEIHLLSPFGQIVAQIRRNQHVVYLKTSEHKTYSAPDVENLTEQILGWRLPLLGLQFWVRGVNSPTTISEMDKDIDGRVVAIRQDGWEVEYSTYYPSKLAQAARPRTLVLNRNNLKIKLVVDNWETKLLNSK